MRRQSALVLALLVAATAGCGAEPPDPPDAARIGPPFGRTEASFPRAGITLLTPTGWRRTDGTAPLVTTVTTGAATIAVWRYPRTEPLPADHDALVAAKGALVSAVQGRDPSFAVRRAKLLKVDGRRAVQVLGTGRIEGVQRTIRSTHVFADGAEIVIDSYAPPQDFARVDGQVFRDLLRTVRIARATT